MMGQMEEAADDNSRTAIPVALIWSAAIGNAVSGTGYSFHGTCANKACVDMIIDIPTISNRHFLVFSEVKRHDTVAVLEDLSSNGTFINDALVGRNKCRELEDGDEVSILDQARFVFRYPRTREANGFHHQYRVLEQLGKGHFATVYQCVERSTGSQYAVKVFEKRQGDSQKNPTESMRPEIALLMAVNHPNLLCLKETFDENDGVYLVTELASEGELFNLIVDRGHLWENETRYIFVQLLGGLKYLVSVSLVTSARSSALTMVISMTAGLFIETSSRRISLLLTRNCG